ncbi:hypothetical protein KCU59_g104, partial [Aureobasidium melanogenum]
MGKHIAHGRRRSRVMSSMIKGGRIWPGVSRIGYQSSSIEPQSSKAFSLHEKEKSAAIHHATFECLLASEILRLVSRAVSSWVGGPCPRGPRAKGAPSTCLRPVKRLVAMGMAYDTVKQITPTPEKALYAATDPK